MQARPRDHLWTVLELIRWGTEYFSERNVESPRLCMELLLCHVLQCSRIHLYAEFERPLLSEELTRLRGYVKRLAHHEPLQYITGVADFYSLQFQVTPDVLIPRPETELLVEQVIRNQKSGVRGRGLGIRDQGSGISCLDIGTGSGCIAVAIAYHLPQTRWLCVDKSAGALEVARRNAEGHGVGDRCEFVRMDVLTQAPSQTFDVITMNPPYIPAREVSALDAVVRDHEPHAALTDDADGLTFYRRLHEVAPELLRSGGSMYVELGWGHAEDVACMFADNWTCHVTNDLTGIPRVLELRQP